MDFTLSQDLEDIRAGVRELCDGFGVGYWRGLEPDRYPLEFVRALTERIVFGRPIGANQGVQFPIARAHMAIEAANLMRWKACTAYIAELPCGAEANIAKFLASEASWQAANACLDTHGGFGFAVDYDIERKFRETRLYTVAPISNNLVQAYVGEHVLGMPRSY